jgi:hypothetical protein
MRKANFQAAITAVLVSFTLLLVGVEQGHAQAGLADGIYTVPAANYVSSADAQIILTDQLTVLVKLLQTLTPGSQQYKTTLRAVMYYRGISSAVQLGKQVPESILSGLSLFATASFGKYTKTEQLGLKQDAIDMLSY